MIGCFRTQSFAMGPPWFHHLPSAISMWYGFLCSGPAPGPSRLHLLTRVTHLSLTDWHSGMCEEQGFTALRQMTQLRNACFHGLRLTCALEDRCILSLASLPCLEGLLLGDNNLALAGMERMQVPTAQVEGGVSGPGHASHASPLQPEDPASIEK